MRRSSMTGALAVLAFIVAGMPASAHHAVQAVFDMKKPITVTGSITKVEWINPHSYISLDAKDDKRSAPGPASSNIGRTAVRLMAAAGSRAARDD